MKSQWHISAIATTLSKQRLSNFDKFEGKVDRWSIENSVGFHFTHHKLNNETSVDLCSEAFAKINVDPKSVDLLIVVSQHTRPNIPPLSAKLAGALKMDPRVYNLDLSIGCTGYVQGLHVGLSICESLNVDKALLFNVETLSEILDPKDHNTNFIFSDAASVTVLERAPGIAMSDFSFSTSGEACLALHSNSGELEMDGLGVFNYVARQVPPSIKRLLADSKLDPTELHAIFFHQASLRTVDKLRKAINLPEVFMPFSSRDIGNTGSCTIPFLLSEFWEEIKKSEKKKAILSSFGSGLSYANAVIHYEF